MGGAQHVCKTVVVMLSVRVVRELQASCHCSFVRWSCSKSESNSSIRLELDSRNVTWKLSSLSGGMGLSIRGGDSDARTGVLAISVFGGIISRMGR